MKVALAFIGGAAVAAIAFLLIETPSNRVPPPQPPAPPAVGDIAVAIAAPSAVPKPEPVAAQVKLKPAPALIPVATQKPKPAPAPDPAPIVAAMPATPPTEPVVAEIARLASAPEPAATPARPSPPVVEKPEAPPLMKPDSLEVRRAREERTAETVTIPAGTIVKVRLNQSLSSELNENGDAFSATLEEPIIVNGFVIAEKGSRLDGRVVDAVRSGRVKGVAKLSVRLMTLHTSDRQRVAIFTEEFVSEGKRTAGRDATRVAVGAGIGAAMGAIFGGASGAAIGAATGGGMGAGSVLLTRGRAAELAVETRIPFRLRDDVTITENLN